MLSLGKSIALLVEVDISYGGNPNVKFWLFKHFFISLRELVTYLPHGREMRNLVRTSRI